MKAVFLLLLLAFAAPVSFAQGFIGRTPSKVKRDLDRHVAKTKVSASFQRTGTTLSLQVRDPKYQPVDFLFRFEKGRCVEEIRTGCDSCVRKYLKEALHAKGYGWTQVNDSTWLSRRIAHRMIVCRKEEPNPSLLIRKVNWDKGQYKAALRS